MELCKQCQDNYAIAVLLTLTDTGQYLLDHGVYAHF